MCCAESPPVRSMTFKLVNQSGYPVPSYLADVFETPPGWVERIEYVDDTMLAPLRGSNPHIYVMACGMVRPCTLAPRAKADR